MQHKILLDDEWKSGDRRPVMLQTLRRIGRLDPDSQLRQYLLARNRKLGAYLQVKYRREAPPLQTTSSSSGTSRNWIFFAILAFIALRGCAALLKSDSPSTPSYTPPPRTPYFPKSDMPAFKAVIFTSIIEDLAADLPPRTREQLKEECTLRLKNNPGMDLSVARLLGSIARTTSNPDVRGACFHCLARSSDMQANAVLYEIRNGSNPALSRAASEAIEYRKRNRPPVRTTTIPGD